VAGLHYRLMAEAEAPAVCELVTRSFGDFIAPDYSSEGVTEFLRYATPAAMEERVRSGGFVWVAEDAGVLAGMAEVRDDRHIALLFVDQAYQHRGIARGLVRHSVELCRRRQPALAQISVNSSPYAVQVYLRLGFAATGAEQEVHGIRFTPMALDLANGEFHEDGEPPPMWDFYTRFYAAAATSRAYSRFCEGAYGRDFGQHGFADMEQLDALLGVTCLAPGDRVLDLGCGNGGIAEYVSDATGAAVTGLDFIPEAIRQAKERSAGKQPRLAFVTGDLRDLDFPAGSFDALIAIDTLYFTELDRSIPQMADLLAPGGRMAIFYSHGANPEDPIETFRRDTLPADRTPLGEALARQALAYRTWDFTAADYRHARLARQVLEELKPAFQDEDLVFLYENRLGEANGIIAAIEAGAHARYLYLVTTWTSQARGRSSGATGQKR
jgi:cyclopropane fatty-acyl-phospholipid synthase-like methyltransferase/GNAT superfamily N-acetyltransferase